jgi:hypothetical protein
MGLAGPRKVQNCLDITLTGRSFRLMPEFLNETSHPPTVCGRERQRQARWLSADRCAGIARAVRLFTRRGHDWTDRNPAIAAAAAKLRVKSFTLDGEAVVTGEDGIAVFDALHRRPDPPSRLTSQCGIP